MILPQPGMFQDWKGWAAQLLVALGTALEPQPVRIWGNYADDVAAATAGVPIGGFYRTGSVLKVRVT